MRNRVLLFTIVAFFVTLQGKAQIVNGGFEEWKIDTTDFKGFATVPAEKYTYPDPVDWTSSNSISAMTVAGGHKFVEQSTDRVAGQYAVRIVTDTIAPINMGPLGIKILTLPGFVMNGNFKVDPSTLVNGLSITPMSVKGAGQAFNQKLSKIKGQYKYEPVFNTVKNANDTCLVWATLRKGNKVIADAIFKSTVSTGNNYAAFEADFKYVSCEDPDTLVILIGSSIPNVPSLFTGVSDVQRGSVLFVDSLNYEVAANGYTFVPIARADMDTTVKNIAKNIAVKLNDEDCDDATGSLTVNVSENPAHGTANVGAGNVYITYTPANNYTGLDTFTYTLNDGTNTSDPARVVVLVKSPTGIGEADMIPVEIYPVPAVNELHIQVENKGRATARVYNMVGQLSANFELNGSHTVVPVTQLQNGIYSIQIVDGENEVIAQGRFTITK